MSVQYIVKRRTIPISFSKEFESLLLNTDTEHISLTHDLEDAAAKGLLLLKDLEDVRDFTHEDTFHALIEKANRYSQTGSEYFKEWYINISEDLLDEVDLILLTHGEDLKELGLQNPSQATILVLVSLAGIT